MREDTNVKLASIQTVAELSQAAEAKAIEADLMFEAYLLHLVQVALKKQFELEVTQA